MRDDSGLMPRLQMVGRVIQRVAPQPMLAVVMGALAALSLAAAVRGLPPGPGVWANLPSLVIAFVLAIAVVVGDCKPIHVTYHTKIALTTIPLYLMAVLLPPPLAVIMAGASRLTGELLERKRRGMLPSDIVCAASRAMVVALLGAACMRLSLAYGGHPLLALFAAALAMFFAELIAGSMEIAAIIGEPPRRVISDMARETTQVEAVQYLLGILGAAAAELHAGLLVLLLVPVVFVYRAFKSARELQTGTRHLLESLADTVDLRDPYTGGHSRRVTDFCDLIMREMGLEGQDAELVLTAARVHDIGKIGIPDGVLNKPGILTDEEREIMQTHSVRGAELLQRYADFKRGVAIVRHHHERWDGQGYPDKIAAYEIPLGARIIAVADSFDAMTSDRPYRRGMSRERALQILHEGRGTQWDPQIVDAFLRLAASAVEQENVKVGAPSANEGHALSLIT